MANLNQNTLADVNAASELVANDAAASVTIDFSDKKDEKMAILIDNNQAYIFTGVIAGNGMHSKAISFTVAANKKAVIKLDSAFVKSNAGIITMACSIATGGTIGTSKIYVIELP